MVKDFADDSATHPTQPTKKSTDNQSDPLVDPSQSASINLDLINMVQAARIAHDAEVKPSQAATMYWVEAKRKTEGAPPTPRAGQWIVRTSLSEVDALWERIKTATETGHLGYKSKVATSPPTGGLDSTDRVIYVRTYDADDSADKERVRLALLEMGIADDMFYTRGS